MASPHLAGAVALLLLDAGITDQGAPGLFDDVRAQLCSTATSAFGVNSTPIPTSDPRYAKYFGCGVIDVSSAVLPLLSPTELRRSRPTTRPRRPRTRPIASPVLANDTDPNSDPLTVTGVDRPAPRHRVGPGRRHGPLHARRELQRRRLVRLHGQRRHGHTDTGAVAVTVTPVERRAGGDRRRPGHVPTTAPAQRRGPRERHRRRRRHACVTTVATAPAQRHGDDQRRTARSPTRRLAATPARRLRLHDLRRSRRHRHRSRRGHGHRRPTRPPVAGRRHARPSAEDGSVDIDVLANDSDPDGGALTVAPSAPPAHGTDVHQRQRDGPLRPGRELQRPRFVQLHGPGQRRLHRHRRPSA